MCCVRRRYMKRNRFLVHRKKRTGDDDECIERENMLRAAKSIELNKFVCARALGKTSPDWSDPS